ncbi:MAG: protein-disulfide reductase DsbD family protein [Gemmatimonadota bacterium]|nr:protein-disulfide reductase DsbD family protein [Gemmatimonadota bacterium]
MSAACQLTTAIRAAASDPAADARRTVLARRVAAGTLALAALALGTARPVAAQGVRGGADSVQVRVAGVERLETVRDGVSGGALVEVRVALEHARTFHSWPDEPVVPAALEGLLPIATAVEVVSLPEGAALESIAWPDPVPVVVRYAGEPLELLSFTDTTVARLRLRLPADGVASDAAARLVVTLQSCDEEYCYPPRRVALEAPLADGPDTP